MDKSEIKDGFVNDLGLSAADFDTFEELGGLEAQEALDYVKRKLKEAKQLSSKIARAERFIEERYEIRLDVVANNLEARRFVIDFDGDMKPQKRYIDATFKDFIVETLDAEMQRANVPYSIGKLKNLIASDFVPEFDPFKNYFESLPPYDTKTGPDYIKKLAEYINIVGDRERFILQLKKHLARCVACALVDGFFNKQVFVLVGEKQNTGKSSFVRWLCPPQLKNYFIENPNLDKDGLISITENFIINLDEIDRLYRQDQKNIKSWISKDSVKARRPYAIKQERMSRRASFFGTANEDDFLTDETGSVRYVVFRLNDKAKEPSINQRYNTEIDINNIWTQAYALFIDSDFNHNLTREETEQNQRENELFKHYTPEMELIGKYFSPGGPDNHTDFLTATEITERIIAAAEKGLQLRTHNVGRALKSLHFEKVYRYDTDAKRTFPGYYIVDKSKRKETLNDPF